MSGIFGSGDTKTYSTTNLTQQDMSTNAADSVSGLLQGANANYQEQNLANSLLISGNTTGGLTVNQFPQAVRDSVADLVGAVKQAVTTSAQTQQAATAALGNKLQDLSLGEASLVPKIAVYVLLGFGLLLLLKRHK